jgi:hypothetical protein
VPPLEAPVLPCGSRTSRSQSAYPLGAAARCAPLEQVPLEHCDRCGCRGSHVGGNQSRHLPTPPLKVQVRPLQQSASVVQPPLVPVQHIPFVHWVRQH